MRHFPVTRALAGSARWQASLLVLSGAAVAVAAPAPVLGPAHEADGPVLAGAPGDQTVPAAAALADGAVVVAWRTSLWEGEVRAARLTGAGDLLDPRGVVLPGLAGPEALLGVGAGAGEVLVVSASEGSLRAVGFAAGGLLAPGPAVELLSAGDQPPGQASPPSSGQPLGRPAVAFTGGGYQVTWSQGGVGVRALRIGPGAQPPDPAVPPLLLSATPGHPALAWDGQRTLMAWSTMVEGRVLLRATRFGAGGARLDDPPLELGTLPGTRAGPTAVAGNGSQFLVAAAGEAGAGGAAAIAAVRVDGEGKVMDGTPLALAQLAGAPEGGPTAIWNGQRFVVLWSQPDGVGVGARPAYPEGRMVAADGTVSPLGLPGLGASGDQPALAVADGQAVAFLSRAAGGRGDRDIRAVRLREDGAGPAGDRLISGGLAWQGNPALAAGGAADAPRLLLAWEDARLDRAGGDIHAVLLDGQGAPLAPAMALATGTAAQQAPAVAWDGRAFQVVWRERGRGLMATRVAADGTPLDRPALLVPGSGGREALSHPVLCGDQAGAVLAFSARREPGAVGPGAELRALRIPPGGNVKEAPGGSLLPTHDVSTPPVLRLACAEEGALLVWAGLYEADRSDQPDLQMALIPRRGELAVARVMALERGEVDEGPALASDGRGFLVAWRPRQLNGGRVTIVGTRVDASGQGLDRPARELGQLNAGHRVSAYWDGAQYVLVGIQFLNTDSFQLRARRVRADLGELDPDWFAIDRVSSRRGTGSLPVAVGLGNGQGLVTYELFADDDATTNQRLRSRRLDTPALDPQAVATQPDAGVGPTVDAGPGPSVARARGGGGCAVADPAGKGGANAWLVIVHALLLAVALRTPTHRGKE